MKIDLNSVDKSQFQVEENIILSNGRSVYFIHPNPSAVIGWDNQNSIFRSSIWDKNGSLISAGFKKFFELNENEKFADSPKDLNDVQAYEKYDGTLLIVSSYGRHIFIRTRGRLDAESIDKKEIDFFRRKVLSKLYDYYGADTWGCSFLFEWISPKHRQVVNYGAAQPFFVLIGCINHNDYTLSRQHELDALAGSTGFPRPQLIQFQTLDGLKNCVANWKDKEGVVIYSKNGQIQHKLKSKWYSVFHKLFERAGDRENIVDAWMVSDQPSFNDFIDQVAKTFTPAFADNLKGEVSIICDAWKEVGNVFNGMSEFVKTKLVPLSPVREVENIIQSAYGQTNRADYVMKLYRGQLLNEDDKKKLLYQCIKNR